MSAGAANPTDVSAQFRRLFGSAPLHVVRAPGRVNLIGEHTDYNDGFVLPMAIDREVRIALSPTGGREVRLHSLDFRRSISFDLESIERGSGWAEYPKGVAWSLLEDGFDLGGFQGCMSGNVPRGSGLSSSAAVELAVARAFREASGFEWEPERVALACQRAENEWLGVNSGIMDQLASAMGKEGHALLIDCRSLGATAVPLPAGTAVLVLDTGTRRGLVGSAYNERREQCEEAARRLGVTALREVDMGMLEAHAQELDPVVFKRARHVVSENGRTVQGANALRDGDAGGFGELMNQSHQSLRDDFEVSSEALDAIAECARAQPGCHGARLTGAGFGGCSVALVREDRADSVAQAVSECYRLKTGREAQVYVCRPAAGAGVVRAQA